eukprot:317027-Rhodomonas_salina.1
MVVSNTASEASQMLLVGGAGFQGMEMTVRASMGGSVCKVSSWQSDSAVACLASGGLMGSGSISVTVGTFVGTASRAASYDGAVVSGAGGRRNLPAGERDSVMIFGEGFVQSSMSVQARSGQTGCEAT